MVDTKETSDYIDDALQATGTRYLPDQRANVSKEIKYSAIYPAFTKTSQDVINVFEKRGNPLECSGCPNTIIADHIGVGVRAFESNWQIINGNPYCLTCWKEVMIGDPDFLPVIERLSRLA